PVKLVITTLITLGAAVGFVLLAVQDPGYVVVARAPHVVRMPLAFFALATVALFAALYLSLNFIAGAVRAPGRWRAWRERRGRARAQAHTAQGYAGLIEGDWAEAERQLLSKMQYNQSPLLNYLGAAYSAQQQGHLRRRDRYLDEALAQHPKQRLAITLTRARLHCQAGEMAQARAALEALRPNAPKSAAAARLLADIYRAQQDWAALAKLLPALTRLQAFPAAELEARRREAYSRYLALPGKSGGAAGAGAGAGSGAGPGAAVRATQAFQSLPRAARKDPAVVANYCAQLIKDGAHLAAETALRKALNRDWNAQLAALYGQAEADADAQIQAAEAWAKKYGERPELTLAQARLHRRARRPEQARGLFMRAVANGAPNPARAELGALLEEMGDKDAALRCYRQGLTAPPTPLSAAPLPPPPPEPDSPPTPPATTDTDTPNVMPAVR
ncbi:MAG: tetratricopeptide repeat protein, partial [Gammaproteobacteria bacterium]|nr:tetratricopeptide repeat protein [Gammaproteobacteria bacterium]